MSTQRVIVRFDAGPTWRSGPPQEQPRWVEHSAFIDRLVSAGTLVMGGPFADYTGAMLLLEGVDADEAGRLFDDDPFVENGVFVLADVRAWTIFVDELSG